MTRTCTSKRLAMEGPQSIVGAVGNRERLREKSVVRHATWPMSVSWCRWPSGISCRSVQHQPAKATSGRWAAHTQIRFSGRPLGLLIPTLRTRVEDVHGANVAEGECVESAGSAQRAGGLNDPPAPAPWVCRGPDRPLLTPATWPSSTKLCLAQPHRQNPIHSSDLEETDRSRRRGEDHHLMAERPELLVLSLEGVKRRYDLCDLVIPFLGQVRTSVVAAAPLPPLTCRAICGQRKRTSPVLLSIPLSGLYAHKARTFR